jgi:hypothetical protein
MCKYFLYPNMLKVDVRLFFAYFFHNPYRVVRKFLQKRGERKPHQYGETPLEAIEKLIKLSGGILNFQHFADLGAGRGRLAYFVEDRFKCKVFAYEQVELFVKKGKKLFPKVTFILGDFLEKDLSKLDLIYLYGTMMTEKQILKFVNKIKGSTKIITISYSLNHYDSRFKTLAKTEVSFPWGKTFGYVQCLRK